MSPGLALATTTIVVNSASAGGATGKRWPTIRLELDQAGLKYQLEFTNGPGHATEITRKALAGGAQCVVAVGGDGTINEVVNGFFDEDGKAIQPSACLALIPSGTGGDFRKSVDVPKDVAGAIACLNSGKTQTVDVGRIDYGDGSHRFFINIADCGLGGEVVAKVNRSKAKGGGLRGTAVFLWTSLATLMTYPGCHVDIEIEGRKLRRHVRNVVIANGKFFGGGMKIAPDAVVNDGLFDVVIVGMSSKLGALTGIGSIYRGTHIDRSDVEVLRGRVVKITSTDDRAPILFDLEGEQIGQVPATLTCVPSAIKIAC